jgi:hypothetical protein
MTLLADAGTDAGCLSSSSPRQGSSGGVDVIYPFEPIQEQANSEMRALTTTSSEELTNSDVHKATRGHIRSSYSNDGCEALEAKWCNVLRALSRYRLIDETFMKRNNGFCMEYAESHQPYPCPDKVGRLRYHIRPHEQDVERWGSIVCLLHGPTAAISW